MLKHPKSNAGFSDIDWREKKFSNPDVKIRLGFEDFEKELSGMSSSK